jgi:transposase
VQTGLAVSGDGGVPVWHRAYDGGAGEVAQVAGAMRALRKLAGPRRCLLVGDSKLVSYANLRDIMAAKVDVIAPASKTYVGAEVLAALDLPWPPRWTMWPSATRASRPSSGAATGCWRTP